MRFDQPSDSIRGPVDLSGRLDAYAQVQLTRRLKTHAGTVVDIDIATAKSTRSTQANRYYWGVVVALATDTNGDTPEDFHDEMCARFLSQRRITIVDTATGEAVEVAVPRRSSGLSIGDFYRFVEQVRQFCAEFLGVETPDPDPSYWRQPPQEERHATV